MDLPAFVSRTIRSRPKGDLASDEDNSASIFCALERKKERGLYTIVNLQLHAVEKNFSRRDLHCWIFFSFLLFFFFFFFTSSNQEVRNGDIIVVELSTHDMIGDLRVTVQFVRNGFESRPREEGGLYTGSIALTTFLRENAEGTRSSPRGRRKRGGFVDERGERRSLIGLDCVINGWFQKLEIERGSCRSSRQRVRAMAIR